METKKISIMADLDPNNIPEAVKEAFAARFPDTTPKQWAVEAEYEAEFQHNGKQVEVTFDADGEILHIETEIDVEDLPPAVIESVKANYPYCEIEEAERVEKGDGTVLYEVNLAFEVQMTADGKLAAFGKDI